MKVSIEPATRAAVEEAALKYGYLRVDDRWIELPFLDLFGGEDPKKRLTRVAVGENGKITGFEVIQVIGPNDAIVEIGWGNQWVRLTGIYATGLTDGRRVELDGAIAIIGTWDYTTVLGARKTVFLAAPVTTLQRGLSDTDVKHLKIWLKSHSP